MNNKMEALTLERAILSSKAFGRLKYINMIIDPSKLKTDIVQSRYTHSIEVANTIDIINYDISSKLNFNIDMYNCGRCIGLFHDIGHSIYGHLTEKELNQFLVDNYGELKISYDSNSNNYIKIEKDKLLENISMDMYEYILASLAKHPSEIYSDLLSKGGLQYQIHNSIKRENIYFSQNNFNFIKNSEEKTIQCQIMDIADEISYTISDINDSFNIMNQVIVKDIFNQLKKYFVIYFKNDIYFNELIESLSDKNVFRQNINKMYFLMCLNYTVNNELKVVPSNKALDILKTKLKQKFQLYLFSNKYISRIRKEQISDIKIICNFLFFNVSINNYETLIYSNYYKAKLKKYFNLNNGEKYIFIEIIRDYISNMTTKGAKKLLKKIEKKEYIHHLNGDS